MNKRNVEDLECIREDSVRIKGPNMSFCTAQCRPCSRNWSVRYASSLNDRIILCNRYNARFSSQLYHIHAQIKTIHKAKKSEIENEDETPASDKAFFSYKIEIIQNCYCLRMKFIEKHQVHLKLHNSMDLEKKSVWEGCRLYPIKHLTYLHNAYNGPERKTDVPERLAR